MTNLSISTVCNLNCVYCFTADYLEDAPPETRFLPLEDFEARLDFLDRSGVDQVRLLGGEPTLHPDFPILVERARARDKTVMVFTNGLMPEKTLACLEALPIEACFVLMNINDPAENSAAVFERQRAALIRLGERVMPGFNIYQPDFRLDFMLDLIPAVGCKPAIRLGIAQPCLSGNNTYIHPKQYPFIGQRIVEFARMAAPHGIKLDFDCGFVPCMFSEEGMEKLRQTGVTTGWHCNPILDIDLHGQVIPCYPLSRLGGLPLTPEINAADLRQTFEERAQPYRQAGIYPICSSCALKAAGECPGGCLAATLRRFRPASFNITVPLP
jgi:hypothetical protein